MQKPSISEIDYTTHPPSGHMQQQRSAPSHDLSHSSRQDHDHASEAHPSHPSAYSSSITQQRLWRPDSLNSYSQRAPPTLAMDSRENRSVPHMVNTGFHAQQQQLGTLQRLGNATDFPPTYTDASSLGQLQQQLFPASFMSESQNRLSSQQTGLSSQQTGLTDPVGTVSTRMDNPHVSEYPSISKGQSHNNPGVSSTRNVYNNIAGQDRAAANFLQHASNWPLYRDGMNNMMSTPGLSQLDAASLISMRDAQRALGGNVNMLSSDMMHRPYDMPGLAPGFPMGPGSSDSSSLFNLYSRSAQGMLSDQSNLRSSNFPPMGYSMRPDFSGASGSYYDMRLGPVNSSPDMATLRFSSSAVLPSMRDPNFLGTNSYGPVMSGELDNVALATRIKVESSASSGTGAPLPRDPRLTSSSDITAAIAASRRGKSASQNTGIGPKRRFQCGYCPKAFQKSSGRVRHERIHTGESPFQCSHCARSFKQKGTLAAHMRLHTGEKPFACPNACGQSFRHRSSLRRHLLKCNSGSESVASASESNATKPSSPGKQPGN